MNIKSNIMTLLLVSAVCMNSHALVIHNKYSWPISVQTQDIDGENTSTNKSNYNRLTPISDDTTLSGRYTISPKEDLIIYESNNMVSSRYIEIQIEGLSLMGKKVTKILQSNCELTIYGGILKGINIELDTNCHAKEN